MYFYIREGRKELWEVSQLLDCDRKRAYLCIMSLFENDFIQPEIEEDKIPEGYHENFSAIPKFEFNNVGK